MIRKRPKCDFAINVLLGKLEPRFKDQNVPYSFWIAFRLHFGPAHTDHFGGQIKKNSFWPKLVNNLWIYP